MPLVMVPKVLQEKLGDDGARAIVERIDTSARSSAVDPADAIDARMEKAFRRSRRPHREAPGAEIAAVKVDIIRMDVRLLG